MNKAMKRVSTYEFSTGERMKGAFKQFVRFGWEQALSCLFPVIIFGSLALTQVIPLPFLPRYDWLLIIFLLTQWEWCVRDLKRGMS